jgi:hypothetical protein
MDVTIPTLDQVDPSEAWQPWRPTDDDPWGRKWAAHLYRRAGFGADRDDLAEAERLGFQGTLDLLLRGRPGADEVMETLADAGRIVASSDDGEKLRGWWLYAMLQGGHPLREKLTLFWHDHFATSLAKVQDSSLMFAQNGLLRRHALGRFGPLLRAIGRDGAMLVWLDSRSNVKGRPNENYARELMELFSLGVGHYNERDVREAARAFTGWRADGAGFACDDRFHDHGPKTVLGQAGNWDGDDVARIVLEQPAAARFLVHKLYRAFVSEQAAPPDSLLEPLCRAFRASDYDVAALIGTILGSRHFYSSHAFRRRIKGPVEYVLGAVRSVYRRYGERAPDYRPLPQRVLVARLRAMGQDLFAPPSVKGWPGGASWLNTATMLERDNFAHALATGTLWPGSAPGSSGRSAALADAPEEPAPPVAYDPARLLSEEGMSRPEDIVDTLLDLHLPGGVRPRARERLVAFLAGGEATGDDPSRRVRAAVHAIMTMAEYHLA